MNLYQQYQQNMQTGQHELALQSLQQHLKTFPQDADGFFQAGCLLCDLGKWGQALSAYHEACRLKPNKVEFLVGLGIISNQLQHPDAAIQAFTAALELRADPGIRYNRAIALLLAGRYQEAWQEYEYRTQVPPKSKTIYAWHPSSRFWHGQPFHGQTLVVYNEQGLGDDIQFCRYLPLIKVLGGKVFFITQKPLIPIMSSLHGIDQLFEFNRSTHASLKNCDWFVPLLSLPRYFHTTLDSIPNQVPYLSVPATYQNKWHTLLAPYKKPGVKNVGFVYASVNDQKIRTCPLPEWRPLFDLPAIQWYSLQKGDSTGALKNFAGDRTNIADLTDHIHDFADTAAMLEQLDLLISIDTSVPHMAGALGKPVWLLAPFIAQWRWLLHRYDSPWYPQTRVFRQPAPGNWHPLISQVAHALSQLQ